MSLYYDIYVFVSTWITKNMIIFTTRLKKSEEGLDYKYNQNV